MFNIILFSKQFQFALATEGLRNSPDTLPGDKTSQNSPTSPGGLCVAEIRAVSAWRGGGPRGGVRRAPDRESGYGWSARSGTRMCGEGLSTGDDI